MTTTRVPKSKATNAFDLLSDVARIALEEPKRIHMNFWKLTADQAFANAAVPLGFPVCNTVGCIGGWTETIAPRRQKIRDAQHILGLTDTQRKELFYPQPLLDEAGSMFELGNAQTPDHAEKVAAHIKAFQKRYRKQLKAQAV